MYCNHDSRRCPSQDFSSHATSGRRHGAARESWLAVLPSAVIVFVSALSSTGFTPAQDDFARLPNQEKVGTALLRSRFCPANCGLLAVFWVEIREKNGKLVSGTSHERRLVATDCGCQEQRAVRSPLTWGQRRCRLSWTSSACAKPDPLPLIDAPAAA